MSSELTKRVLFGVIAAPIAIAILLYGGAPLAGLLAIVSALGAWEFFRIARAGGLTPFDDLGTAVAGIIPLLVHAYFLGVYHADGAIGPLSLVAVTLLCLLGAVGWSLVDAHRSVEASAAASAGRIQRQLQALYWQKLVWRHGMSRVDFSHLACWLNIESTMCMKAS